MSARAPSHNGTADAEAQALLREAATPELYARNGFRVLELPVDATSRDIHRRRQMLEMAAANGVPAPSGPARCFPLDPPPDEYAVREAMQRLADPEHRLVDEFFWFWPHEQGQSRSDQALQHLAQGRPEEAARVWTQQEANRSVSHVSTHNLAVLHHLLALQWENHARANRLDAEEQANIAQLWNRAFRRWQKLLDEEGFWSRLTARVREFEDPRLTAGSVRRIRAALPAALLSINAQLALQAVADGNRAAAARLVEVIRSSGFPQHAITEGLRQAVEPARNRIKALCRTAQQIAETDPVRAAGACDSLLDAALPLLAGLDCVLPPGDPTREVAHDDVAEQALRCQVAYAKKTQQWQRSVQLLERAAPLAASASVLKTLQDNLAIVRGNAETGNDFCGDGYHDLPPAHLEQMEQARERAEGQDFEQAVAILEALPRSDLMACPRCGRALQWSRALAGQATCCACCEETFPVAETPELFPAERRPLLDKALAYCLCGRGIQRVNRAGQGADELPPTLKKALARLRLGGNLAHGLGEATCAACGEFLGLQFYTITFRDTRLQVCLDCHARIQAEDQARKKRLQEAVRLAAEDLLRAGQLDPANAFIEFKRHMGTSHQYTFARTGRKMTPEELSAEVLKALRADVERRTGEAITAAVVTVPADFDLPQCEATKRAAGLAGLQHCLLLQEPVAAAQAYSFEKEEDKTFWLVYDFGGGTFDAAIIQVRDGLIQVVGHGGDNQLGGKNLDWAIVEQLFIPALLQQRALSDLGRHNPARWGGAIAKLKIQAEEAKIRLSAPGVESTEVQIDFLCKDDRGEPVEFSFELQRAELQRLAAPFIRRTLHICKETLAGRRLAPGNIAKLILVGGPTLMPFLREQLQDPAEGLGIPLEFNVDPLTVVARGAAVFAATQRVPDEHWAAQVRPGQYAVKLDYTPVGPDTEPPVAGVVSAGEGVEQDFTGFTIEFINPDIRPPWRSGKIGLGPKGNFMTTVSAEKGKANTFQIELRDPTGALQEVNPKTFQITVKGVGAVQITLPHAIGVALANNEVVQFFDKGTVIPARKRRDLHTALALQRGQSGQFLRVPVVEGNKSRADRNRMVGTLRIPAEKIARDVPAGSDLEVTIEIDQSRLIRTKAFIPILDEEFEEVLKLESAVPDAQQLAERLRRAKDRLKTTRQKADAAQDPRALELLRQIDSECMVPEAERLVTAAAGDSDAARQCLNLLNSLESTLDDAEDALEWPTLVTEAEKVLDDTRQVVETSPHATAEDKREFAALERETREAIEHHVPDLLRRRLDGLQALRAEVALRDPGPWLYLLDELKDNRAAMSDPALAERLFAQADRAVQNNDFAGLRAAVVQLLRLSGERLKKQFDDLKAARARMTDQARAAALIAAGERAAAQNDMAELTRIIHQLKQLLSGVVV